MTVMFLITIEGPNVTIKNRKFTSDNTVQHLWNCPIVVFACV